MYGCKSSADLFGLSDEPERLSLKVKGLIICVRQEKGIYRDFAVAFRQRNFPQKLEHFPCIFHGIGHIVTVQLHHCLQEVTNDTGICGMDMRS